MVLQIGHLPRVGAERWASAAAGGGHRSTSAFALRSVSMHSTHKEWRQGPLTNVSVGFRQIGQHSVGSEEEEEQSSSLDSSLDSSLIILFLMGRDSFVRGDAAEMTLSCSSSFVAFDDRGDTS